MTLKISSLLTFSAITAATFFIATSCKKSNSSSGGGGTSLSATISGSAWSSTIPSQNIYEHTVGIFQLIGGQFKSGDTTALYIEFNTPFPLHTAISSDTANVDIDYVDAKTQVEYDGSPLWGGHTILTVSSWDSVNHKISGTFSAVLHNTGGSDSLVVTNGNFNTAYTVQ